MGGIWEQLHWESVACPPAHAARNRPVSFLGDCPRTGLQQIYGMGSVYVKIRSVQIRRRRAVAAWDGKRGRQPVSARQIYTG